MNYYTWNRLSRLALRTIRANQHQQAWNMQARRRYTSALSLRDWLWRNPEDERTML